MKNKSIGERIRDYAHKHAEDENALSIQNLAKELGEDEHVIAYVLDRFYVSDEDRSVVYVGSHLGGNWAPVKEPNEAEVLQRQLEDNVITQEDYDLRMELIARGEDPRSAEALQALVAEFQAKVAEKQDG